MAEQQFATFDEMSQHIYRLYVQGEYAEALAVITREAPRFPERIQDIRHLRACLLAVQGQGDEALGHLREAIEDGHWFSETVWADTDFDSIREHPEFARLKAISGERRQGIQAQVRPELLTVMPGDTDPAPLLVALHGNGSNVRWHKAHWSPAARMGWLVAMPQSTQLSSLDSEGQLAFVWNNEDTNVRELQQHLAAVEGGYAPDRARAVWGGFSRGAELALTVALAGDFSMQGVVAVCPGGPRMRTPESWEPLIAQGQGRDLRVAMVMGGQDTFVPGTEKLVTMLREAGIPVELAVYPEMGHDYPADFARRLPDLLTFALGS
ncbi:MAG: hypothetical protein GYB65_04195 [Chloroflexi bacterium]|nr:hypothetical protein [Chloroflexota bacterium]